VTLNQRVQGSSPCGAHHYPTNLADVLTIFRPRTPSGLTHSKTGLTLLFGACSSLAAQRLGDARHFLGEVGAACIESAIFDGLLTQRIGDGALVVATLA
jgi:hypothetical protein